VSLGLVATVAAGRIAFGPSPSPGWIRVLLFFVGVGVIVAALWPERSPHGGATDHPDS